MSNLTTVLNDREYQLATTLRVAYMIQGQHNHKPYAEVLQSIGEMTLEEQIDIIYQAFKCANPDAAKEWTSTKFCSYYLDNYTMTQMVNQVQAIVEGIIGKDEDSNVAPQAAEGN